MDQHQLQKEILSCIWSKDLKTYIAENDCTFTDEALLSIAYHFAPTYDERLRLLRLLAENAPAVSKLAAECIVWQRDCLEKFCQIDENELYELCIKDGPDAYGERYLCATYQTALDMIDAFYREYDSIEKRTSRYVISKRKILQPTDAFQEDELQECVLGPGKVLLSAEIWGGENDPKSRIVDVCFPDFVPDQASVRYQLPDGSIQHGIHLSFNASDITDTCYIIPLGSEMLRTGDYEKRWGCHWHEHIPFPNVEIVQAGDLSDDEKDNYLAFLEYWKKHMLDAAT